MSSQKQHNYIIHCALIELKSCCFKQNCRTKKVSSELFTKTSTAVATSLSEQLQDHKSTGGTNGNRDNNASTTGIINIGDHSTISLINLTSTATIPADTFTKHKLPHDQQQQ
ncbi:hypothetical protein PoB_004670500 [Plakobranchus ocellatus]|uniref:Uncharacterized protein n=1 Tax=Plakobranchus ocellatus TaxID=259542 RepID=A0AAV4BI39_9GAST|nr:hypothetical protein PoB_004670500 [Plakobranchus ocellatus]